MPTPGTNSTAYQNADGTWDIRDVEIVPEGTIPRFNKSGEHVDDFPTTVDWFRQVIAVHAAREREGYMGRVFIDHHGSGDGSQPDAGYFRPKRIGSVSIHGEKKPALFVDLISVPDDVYQTWVKVGRVPYRSIESLIAERGFIDGLALMPTRSPHYEMSMLSIGDEVLVPGGTGSHAESAVAAVACASSEHARILFARHTEPDMADDDKKTKEETPEAKGEGGGGESEGGIDVAAVCKAIEDGSISIAEFADVRAAMDAADASVGGEEPAEEEILEEEPMEADVPLAEQEPMSASKRVIRAEAIATAAKATANGVRDELAMRDAVSTAVDEMADFNIGSDPREHLRAYAAKNGLEALSLYTATIKAHATKSPGSAGASGSRSTESDLAELPPEVMAYTDPGERSAAIKANRQYQSQVKGGYPMGARSLANTIKRAVARGA